MSSLSWKQPNIDISTLVPINSLIILFGLTSTSVVTIVAEFLFILLIVGIIMYKKGENIILVDDQYEYVSKECVKKYITCVCGFVIKVKAIIEKISKETITTFAVVFGLFVILFISENLPAWFNVVLLLVIVNATLLYQDNVGKLTKQGIVKGKELLDKVETKIPRYSE